MYSMSPSAQISKFRKCSNANSHTLGEQENSTPDFYICSKLMKKEQETIIPIHVTLVSFGLMFSVRSQIGFFFYKNKFIWTMRLKYHKK